MVSGRVSECRGGGGVRREDAVEDAEGGCGGGCGGRMRREDALEDAEEDALEDAEYYAAPNNRGRTQKRARRETTSKPLGVPGC